jgi:phosphatidylethanolamine-binding protein (PEBP) family uncharacterized protein
MNKPPSPYDSLPAVASFALASNDVADGETLAPKHRSGIFGAGGDDVSPHLKWHGFSQRRRPSSSPVSTLDAPTGSGFWHWVVAHIPASVTELDTNAEHVRPDDRAWCHHADLRGVTLSITG